MLGVRVSPPAPVIPTDYTNLRPNITLGGNLGNWTFEDFSLALRAGQTPDRRQLNNEMPWAKYSIMSDVEVRAIWEYIQLVNAREDNQ